jgi:hypothetical protein
MEECMDFNYAEGGTHLGAYYPSLKPVPEAIRFTDGSYFHYEPGNGTRYEVIFTKFDAEHEKGQVVMTVVCPRRTAMFVDREMGMYSLGYMQEKLVGMYNGDCYALIPLINHYLKENK